MATGEWYYSKDGERVGPVSSAELKRLAATGAVLPSDLVWKQGWPEWKPASNLNGLFASASSAPPPLKDATPEIAHEKTLTQRMGEAAKTTALRAKKQAERTKISSVSLLSAFSALGKQALVEGSLRSELPELFAESDSLRSAIEGLELEIANRPMGESASEKARSLAMTAKNKAEIQTRKVQYSKLAAKIGKQVHADFPERVGSDHVEVVEKHLSRLREIDAELASLAESDSPTGIASEMTRSAFVIATLVTCCFPIGLLFVWKNPQWSKKTKWTWTGATLAVLFGMAVIGNINEAKRLEQVEAANSQWRDGDRESALSTYRELTKHGPFMVPDQHRATVYGRLIEFDVEHAREQSARKLAEDAVNYGIEPTMTLANAQRFFRDVGKEVELRKQSVAAASSASDALSEDYFPYQVGTQQHYVRNSHFGDQKVQSDIEETFGRDNVIRSRNIDSFIVGGKGGSIPFAASSDKHYRKRDGFIELGQMNDGSGQMDWLRWIKIGATAGEQWEQVLYGETITFTLQRFEDRQLHLDDADAPVRCTVIKQSSPYGQAGVIDIDTTFAKGIGIFHQICITTANGESEINWSQTLRPPLDK